jgi:hypothetical protein
MKDGSGARKSWRSPAKVRWIVASAVRKRRALLASHRRRRADERLGDVPHHEHRLPAVGSRRDDRRVDLRRQALERAAQPQGCLAPGSAAQHAPEQVAVGNDTLHDHGPAVREHRALDPPAGLTGVDERLDRRDLSQLAEQGIDERARRRRPDRTLGTRGVDLVAHDLPVLELKELPLTPDAAVFHLPLELDGEPRGDSSADQRIRSPGFGHHAVSCAVIASPPRSRTRRPGTTASNDASGAYHARSESKSPSAYASWSTCASVNWRPPPCSAPLLAPAANGCLRPPSRR